jgi:hypothetical protein
MAVALFYADIWHINRDPPSGRSVRNFRISSTIRRPLLDLVNRHPAVMIQNQMAPPVPLLVPFHQLVLVAVNKHWISVFHTCACHFTDP